MKTEMKNAGYYMGLPYTLRLKKDEDGDIVARIEELKGCIAHGSTEIEALERLKEVQQVWIESCLESGDPIPEPEIEQDLPSGKWVQRVPRTLHQKLIRLARREEVSLNQLVTSILSAGVEKKDAQESGQHLLSEVRSLLASHQQMTRRSMHDLYRKNFAASWLMEPELMLDIDISKATRKALKMGVVPNKNEFSYTQNVNQEESPVTWRQ